MERPVKSTFNQFPGAVYNAQNAQLSISTGIGSLDAILGGGLPVGTVAVIEEDIHGSYARVMLDYFLAEGIVCGHSTFVASLDTNPYNIIKNLPAVVSNNVSSPQIKGANADSNQQQQMTIAFRYQNLPTSSENQAGFAHSYDLTRKLITDDDHIARDNVTLWNCQKVETIMAGQMFSNVAYGELLKSIRDKIKDAKFFLKDGNNGILRIGVHSLGSPLWLPHNDDNFKTRSESRDLDMFIFCLRALVRSAFAVALITIPSHLYQETTLDRCIHSSDIAMHLQAFSGTELEKNSSLSDYHGFFHLKKLAAINTFASKHPGSVEYVFKLRRKKFQIEKLHLPPDLGETNATGGGSSKKTISVGCGGSPGNLDF